MNEEIVNNTEEQNPQSIDTSKLETQPIQKEEQTNIKIFDHDQSTEEESAREIEKTDTQQKKETKIDEKQVNDKENK